MSARLLFYLVEVWSEHLRDHPKAKTLPLAIPLVLFQGPGKWTAPTNFKDLFGVAPPLTDLLARYIPTFDYHVVNLAEESDEDVDYPRRVGLLLHVLKHRGDDELLAALPGLLRSRRTELAPHSGLRALSQLVKYFLEATDYAEADLERALETVVGEESREFVMTRGQQLRAEGRDQGREQGRREILTRFLTTHFGSPSTVDQRRIAYANMETLDRWLDSTWGAASTEEVLAS